jgi:hypothetical protein
MFVNRRLVTDTSCAEALVRDIKAGKVYDLIIIHNPKLPEEGPRWGTDITTPSGMEWTFQEEMLVDALRGIRDVIKYEAQKAK